MKNNRKGFTLIELLVCITILGIIMGMSIPVIRNITVKNSNTKYSSYLDTVVNAAKLYVDSYGEDLFGHYDSGCNYVTFEDLKDKSLVKDYNADGITCDTTSTFVEVTKFNDSYSYKGFLGCAKKSDTSKLIYTLPNNDGNPNNQDPATCAGIDVSTTIGILAEPNSYNELDQNSVNVKLKVKARMGIRRDPSLKVMYKWSTSNVDFTTDGMYTANIIDNVPTEAAQRLDLSEGRMITVDSSYFSTPVGESGKVYLIIYSDNLMDLYDVPWSYNDSNYMAFGPYNIDNEPPVFDNSSAIVSTKPSYNYEIPKLSIGVNDDVTPTAQLKMCVSYNGFCEDWENFDGSKILDAIPGFQYDGSTYTVYVSVKDVAGNVSQKEFSYRSYVKCSSTVAEGSWEGSCPSCGSNVQIIQTKTMKDAYLGAACPDATQPFTCNIPACCSSTRNECTDWGEYGACSKECCGGTMTRTRTCRKVSNYNGSDCGAVNDSSEVTQSAICNKQACAPFISDENSYGITYSCDTTYDHAGSRSCSVWWNTSVAEDRNVSVSAYRVPSYGDAVWMSYSKFNSESAPYCNWIKDTDCRSIPIGGVFKYRLDQPSSSLIGGIATFDSIKNY